MEPLAVADDLTILQRLRAQDPAVIEGFVRSNSGRLLSVARRMLGNEADAQDAVQDAFLNAFRSLDSFHGDARLSTWLHRILVRAALMKLRRRHRKPETSIDDLLPKFRADGHAMEPAVSRSESPTTALERREVRDQVQAAIDRLPENYRTVLVLRDIEGVGTEEAAQMLGESPAAVKTRLHRARMALRGLLDPIVRGGQP
ncbi:MAG TPA: sigma-70 family RNA polymerase sigma factor [Gemmataceae bacterium]|jgi:RNA polymerase sigma-70 factor (ECF subfamily)|nr:sigma-70 family RNA polymerase sigma factor [Gemmataceae bacterium]